MKNTEKIVAAAAQLDTPHLKWGEIAEEPWNDWEKHQQPDPAEGRPGLKIGGITFSEKDSPKPSDII